MSFENYYWKSFLFFNYATQLLKTGFNNSSIFRVLDVYEIYGMKIVLPILSSMGYTVWRLFSPLWALGIYGLKMALSILSSRDIWLEDESVHSEHLYWKSDGTHTSGPISKCSATLGLRVTFWNLGSFQGRFLNETWPANIWANEGVKEFGSLNGLRSQRIRVRTLETSLTNAISCHWVEKNSFKCRFLGATVSPWDSRKPLKSRLSQLF